MKKSEKRKKARKTLERHGYTDKEIKRILEHAFGKKDKKQTK